MLIFVYGDDGVRAKQKLFEFTSRFQEKFDPSGMNFVEFPAPGSSEIPFAEVLTAVQSAPFLSEKRMVVIRGLMDGLKKDDARQWAEGLSRTPSSSIVVLVDVAPKATVEKHELFKQLQGQAEVHAYAEEKREGAALKKWLIDEARKKGATLAIDVAEELARRFPDDTWRLANELDKLASYAGSGLITMDTLNLLSARSSSSNIFAFVDAVSQRDGKKALQLLAEERAAGSADLYLLAMLARQVRILLQIQAALAEDPSSERTLPKRLGLHPYVAQKSLTQAKRFTLRQLVRLHGLVARFDREAKRGGIDPALAVDRLAAEMLDASPTFR